MRAPGPVAALLPNPWLMLAAWLFGGLYVLLAVGSLAELATMLPRAGGAFNYVQLAFGRYAGFVTGWFSFLSNAIAPAFFTIAISEYLGALFPRLHGREEAVAVAVLVGFTLLHLSGVKTGNFVQQLFSSVKVLALLVLVGCCFVLGHAPWAAPATTRPGATAGGALLIGFLQALQLITGTYDGWDSPTVFAEEDVNPAKNLPRALFGGALAVLVVYMLLNAAVLWVLPIKTLAGSKLALADAAGVIFGPPGAVIITLIALFSLLSILNAQLMVTPRILYGLSREGFFAGQGTTVNAGGTPAVALLATAGLGLVLIVNSSFERLFALGAFMNVLVFTLMFASVFKLRRARPDFPRPFRAWGYPWSTLLLVLVSAGLFGGFAFADPKNFGVIVLVIALTWLAFQVGVRRQQH